MGILMSGAGILLGLIGIGMAITVIFTAMGASPE